MNQILNQNNLSINIEFSDEVIEIKYLEYSKMYKLKNLLKKYRYRIQFYFSLIVAIITSCIFGINIKKSFEKEKVSEKILANYNLTTIYEKQAPNKLSNQLIYHDNPFVIGMLCIPKINLTYPILSHCNSDLLKISLCRFAGPFPNTEGNLCIAGHNYIDDRFFGKLDVLNINDFIEIYDLSGTNLKYVIYDKYEVVPTDLSCANQNVLNNKIVTLTTCNNVNGKILVIKAKEQK